MTGEFLSLHGSFLFICGLALGFVLRSRSLKAHPPSALATWNDAPWSEITRIDGDAPFAPQLVNLHKALLHPQEPVAACISAKARAPV
jgi:hypothetical protein